MKTITKSKAAHLIETSGGKLFGVTFIKRSDGSRRRMTARRGVMKGVNGTGKSFSATAHGLLTVCEFTGGYSQFRHIPIEGIQYLKIRGEAFQVI
jgi:hypothetical protein